MKTLFTCAGLLFLCWQLNAQSFNYSFTQSAASYQALAGATLLASGSAWSSSGYKIPIGFSFPFEGKSYDSLTLASNGFLKFGDDNKRAIAAFTGINPAQNSAVVYKTESGILKIEFKNCSFNGDGQFSFQAWLHADGKVELRTGSAAFSSVQDSLAMPLAGVLNPAMDEANNGFLIAGNPSSASGEALTGAIKHLVRVPDPDMVYTLTPQ